MPDDVPHPVREGLSRAVNWLDGFYEFEAAFHRPPRSWRDYSYGMAHLARAGARESLRMAAAGRMAQAVKAEDWQRWADEQRLHADW